MRISVFDHHKKIHLSTRSSRPSAVPPSDSLPIDIDGGFSDEWQANAFVRRYFADPHSLAKLRDALAADGYDVARDMDDELIGAVALLIARGAWNVSFEGLGAVQSVIVATRPRGEAVERAPQQRGTRRESVIAAAPSGLSKSIVQEADIRVPEVTDWPTYWDQLAQAITLEKAARNRTPFCAICAELAEAKAEGTQI